MAFLGDGTHYLTAPFSMPGHPITLFGWFRQVANNSVGETTIGLGSASAANAYLHLFSSNDGPGATNWIAQTADNG